MLKNNHGTHPEIEDYGPNPFIFNVNHATLMNQCFRRTLWTGNNMQLTLMSIPVRGNIGVEMHEHVDQFIRIEGGSARIYLGRHKYDLRDAGVLNENYAVIIPAGTWHNIVNTGNRPLKLYSLYAPPQHPFGTTHRTKTEAEHMECHD